MMKDHNHIYKHYKQIKLVSKEHEIITCLSSMLKTRVRVMLRQRQWICNVNNIQKYRYVLMLNMHSRKFQISVGATEGFGAGPGEGNAGVSGVDIPNCVWYCWTTERRGVVPMMTCTGT